MKNLVIFTSLAASLLAASAGQSSVYKCPGSKEIFDSPIYGKKPWECTIVDLGTGWRQEDALDRYVIFANHHSFKRTSRYSMMWFAQVPRKMILENGKEIGSIQELIAVDCLNGRYAVRASARFSTPDGKGQAFNFVSLQDEELRWRDAVPNSLQDTMKKITCQREKE